MTFMNNFCSKFNVSYLGKTNVSKVFIHFFKTPVLLSFCCVKFIRCKKIVLKMACVALKRGDLLKSALKSEILKIECIKYVL